MPAREAAASSEGLPLRAGFDLAGRLGLERHCVLRDAYDAAAFESFLREGSRLEQCSRRGEARLRSFPALLSDLFCLLFKLRPRLIDRSLVRPAFLVNRYLVARLAAESEVKCLRARTPLNEDAAASAAVSLAERLLRELTKSDFSQENQLFELEESIGQGGVERKSPSPVRRKASEGSRSRAGAEADGAGAEPLGYDLQQCLEMAEAFEGYRGFAQLLRLTQGLVGRLARNDPTGFQPTEVYDIGLGDELSRLLPCELLSLRASPWRKDFLRRLISRQLFTYQMTGREWSGSLVILVDVSHSMAGEKELISKALAIALSRVAAARGQPVHVILFGHREAPLWQIDFKSRTPQRHEIVALAETFFGGGTNFQRPISTALDLISGRGDGAGQIVFISDGQCEVAEDWLAGILAKKARRQVRILTVLVDSGSWSDRSATSFSDTVARWSMLAEEG